MKKILSFVVCTLLIISIESKQEKLFAQDDFFQKIRTEKVISDSSVSWKNFGPGMSGYCEEFWCHPTDTNVMFMGPDMHVSFGTWDNGKSWHTIKDSDGDGQDLVRVHDIQFSLVNPDYGVAIEREGKVFETKDRGRSWTFVNDIGKAHTKLAIHPTNDNIWYVGAGDFWNVKNNHRSQENPYGIKHKRANYGYIKKTTNKGKTWTKIATNISEDLDVGRIIIHPANPRKMIMATSHGVFLSKNGGKKWTESAKGLPNNLPRDLTSYYNEKTEEFILYLVEQTKYKENGKSVTTEGGIYKSTDGGESWEDITGNLYFDISSISFMAEKDRFHRTMAYWFGISKKESKQKFTELPKKTLSVFNRIVVNPKDKNEIYVSFNKKHDFTFGAGDVWKTENGGKTWVVCARQGAYWKSNKDKAYWTKRNNPTGTNITFAHLHKFMDHEPARSGNRMLAVNAAGDVYIGIDQQTLKSSDKGKSWVQIDDYETSKGSGKWIGRGGSNLPGRFMLLETGIPNRRLLCSGEHGLWQTTTELGEWNDKQAVAVEQVEGQNHKHGAHSISTVAVHPKDPNTIYFLSWRQSHRGKLRKTTDGGKTWENISTIFDVNSPVYRGLAAQNSLVIDPVNPKNMYFCATHQMISEVGGGKGPKLTKGSYGFYRSSDGGYNWEVSNNGLPQKASVRRLAMHPDNPKVIYAALNDNQGKGGLYITINKGVLWKKVNTPSVIKSVNNVFIDRNNKHIYICTGRKSGTYKEGGVWRSEDNGKTWTKIFKAPYVWQAETSPVNPKLIVISVPVQKGKNIDEFKNPGLYLSKDGGKTWKKINKNLGQPDKIVDVKPDPYNENVLWCASWGCGWYVAYLNGTSEGWKAQ